MITAALIVFGVCIAAFIYTFFGYPVLVGFISRVRPRRPAKAEIFPSVTIIVPAYNEGKRIGAKLENLQALDYPPDQLQIIVVSDASTDDTVDKCRASGVTVVEMEQRSGKSAALNKALEHATGEIIGFTDAAIMLAPDALSTAVTHFADPRVGCVSAEDEVVTRGGVGIAERLYIHTDTVVRRLESIAVSATGMNGSYHLVRRSLCPPFPLEVATDMYTSLYCVSCGYWATVEPESMVRVEAQTDASREFGRKVRTMITGLAAVVQFPQLLNPFRFGLFSLCLFSHKILRYMIPLFAALLFVSTFYLALYSPVFITVLGLETATACVTVLKINAKTTAKLPRVFAVPAFFGIAVAAAAAAWYRFANGERAVVWQPTERSASDVS